MVTPTRLYVTLCVHCLVSCSLPRVLFIASCPVHTHYGVHSVPIKMTVTKPVQRLPANGVRNFMILLTKAYRWFPSWNIRILSNVLKLSDPEDGGITVLWNVSNYLPVDQTDVTQSETWPSIWNFFTSFSVSELCCSMYCLCQLCCSMYCLCQLCCYMYCLCQLCCSMYCLCQLCCSMYCL